MNQQKTKNSSQERVKGKQQDSFSNIYKNKRININVVNQTPQIYQVQSPQLQLQQDQLQETNFQPRVENILNVQLEGFRENEFNSENKSYGQIININIFEKSFQSNDESFQSSIQQRNQQSIMRSNSVSDKIQYDYYQDQDCQIDLQSKFLLNLQSNFQLEPSIMSNKSKSKVSKQKVSQEKVQRVKQSDKRQSKQVQKIQFPTKKVQPSQSPSKPKEVTKLQKNMNKAETPKQKQKQSFNFSLKSSCSLNASATMSLQNSPLISPQTSFDSQNKLIFKQNLTCNIQQKVNNKRSSSYQRRKCDVCQQFYQGEDNQQQQNVSKENQHSLSQQSSCKKINVQNIKERKELIQVIKTITTYHIKDISSITNPSTYIQSIGKSLLSLLSDDKYVKIQNKSKIEWEDFVTNSYYAQSFLIAINDLPNKIEKNQISKSQINIAYNYFEKAKSTRNLLDEKVLVFYKLIQSSIEYLQALHILKSQSSNQLLRQQQLPNEVNDIKENEYLKKVYGIEKIKQQSLKFLEQKLGKKSINIQQFLKQADISQTQNNCQRNIKRRTISSLQNSPTRLLSTEQARLYRKP